MKKNEKAIKYARWNLLSNRRFQIQFILFLFLVTLFQAGIHYLSAEAMSREIQVALAGARGLDPALQQLPIGQLVVEPAAILDQHLDDREHLGLERQRTHPSGVQGHEREATHFEVRIPRGRIGERRTRLR